MLSPSMPPIAYSYDFLWASIPFFVVVTLGGCLLTWLVTRRIDRN